MELHTIGGYGFDESKFVAALRNTNVDTFVDIRQRRGVRGRRYSFLNSLKLQEILAELNIRYVHLSELAPTTSIREIQSISDKRSNIAKRQRTSLSAEFVDAYSAEVLEPFHAEKFLAAVGPNAKVVVLFCVESAPEACHRSLVSKRLSTDLGVQVGHIRP